jgi:hypothetical protein
VFPTPTSIGTLLRKKAMEFIENDARINSNFTIFDRYFHHQSEEFQNQNLQHYLKSMSDTQYILTIRGCGNYSIRQFETMAANRIPVMVDTNQYLPFEDIIPWKEIGVWVPFPDFNSISDFIYNFHEKLNQKSFDELTREIENIYENYLSRPSVVKQIRQILLEYA